MKKDKTPSAFSRLMEYAGNYKILTYLSWILSFLSALTALLPLVYIFFIIREVLEVAPDFSKATSIVHNGVMAVVFSAAALVIYIGALMCSHVSAFRIGSNIKRRLLKHISIASGRCAVIQGNVAELPFDNESFELATAFETVYFWPGLERCFSEVCRVLKPGGRFMICNESDGTDETSLKYEKIIEGMKCYTVDELTSALKAAGFTEVISDRYDSKPWITVIARK